MITLALIGYILVALIAFVIAVHINRGLIAQAIEDDPAGASFCVLSIFFLSAVWPMTALIFALAGIAYIYIKGVLAGGKS